MDCRTLHGRTLHVRKLQGRILVRLLAVICVLLVSSGLRAESFRIAASSSLQFALNDVIESYVVQSTRSAPQIVYGSSGNLYRQIVQGAPFQLFFSARGELTTQLFEQGVSKDAGDSFGSGRLVLLLNESIDLDDEIAIDLDEFIRLNIVDKNLKLAIANPAHAPYGRAAREVLQSLGVWQEVQSSLINGEQVSQATRFVASGAASFGMVSLSLALAPAIEDTTQYVLIDMALHNPVEHKMVRLTASAAAEHFYQYVLYDERALEIFRRYGLR